MLTDKEVGSNATSTVIQKALKINSLQPIPLIEGYNPSTIAKNLNEDGVPTGTGRTKWYVSGVLGILRNEKHKGDALLQKTFTADFLTKKMVKNTGQVEQIYVKDSHPAIIDKEQWEAVQLELDRRDAFMKEVDTKFYGYGENLNPFSGRVVCGHCGSLYLRKSWGSRGIYLWQCKNHMEKGTIMTYITYLRNQGDDFKEITYAQFLRSHVMKKNHTLYKF